MTSVTTSAASILATVALLATRVTLQGVEVRRPPEPTPEVKAWRGSLPEGRPALRGFRAPVLDHRAETRPIEPAGDAATKNAAAIVERDLARRGLLATTAAATESLASSREAVGTEDLRAIGLPVDWLEFFRDTDSAFAFRPSLPGFEVATESGEHEIETVRLQITSGTYWSGAGDGGCVDLARQLIEALPEARFVASVQESHLAGLLETAGTWPPSTGSRLVLLPEALPVAQWAQDGGKSGRVPVPGGQGYETVTLVPRYASRGEAGAAFVPGETFLVDGFASAGLRAVQSPLLFQGGDLLAARDPKDGSRILFLGEANVWRNTALGLTQDQVLEAFRIEFGVDRCVVLPAVSFHLDQELTLRAVGDRLVGFVADPVPAAKIVLACGLDAVRRSGALDAASAAQARADLEAGKYREFLERVFPAVGARGQGFGRHPESFSAFFSSGASDSGVGNLQRFLLALDLLVAWSMPVDELPLEPHSLAYLRSFLRTDADRREMIARLRSAGVEIAPVPSLPEGERGIDYLNGIHEPGRYLMPAWGGLYAPLDRAAEDAFRKALGPGNDVHPVLTSESQRRGGAIHCSISALPGR